MDLNHLRTFVAVVEEGNLTKAAERLFITPPAISIHIKLLEDELGISLFNRTAKGMKLSDHGHQLIDKAKHTLQSAQDMVNIATDMKDFLLGTLRVGLNSHPDILDIGKVVAHIRSELPGVQLTFSELNTGKNLEGLKHSLIDVAYCYGSVDPISFDNVKIKDTELVLAYPSIWEKEKIEDLTKWDWISSDHYCPFEKLNVALWEKFNIRTPKKVSTNSEATKIALIKSGIGAGYIEKSLYDLTLSDSISCFNSEKCTIESSIVLLKSRENEPLIKAFLETVREVYETRI